MAHVRVCACVCIRMLTHTIAPICAAGAAVCMVCAPPHCPPAPHQTSSQGRPTRHWRAIAPTGVRRARCLACPLTSHLCWSRLQHPALAAGDEARFHAILAPTVPLSRHIFGAPTRFYKTGVVFMAWLNGHQDHFVMVGGQQSTRSLPHLCELFRLADAAGLIEDPERAAARMRHLLAMHGVDA